MNMTNKKALARLLQDVMATGPRELSPDEALDQMMLSAEAGLSDDESRQQYPDLWRFFRFYPEARDQYDIVVESYQNPAPARRRPLPPRPDSISLWDQLKNVISHVFPAPTGPALARARGDTERTSVVQLDDTYRLTVTTNADARDPRRRRLSLFVETDDAAQARLEGSPVWLQVGDDGPTIGEYELDDEGGLDVAEGLEAGDYTLRLQLDGQHYAVTGVRLGG